MPHVRSFVASPGLLSLGLLAASLLPANLVDDFAAPGLAGWSSRNNARLERDEEGAETPGSLRVTLDFAEANYAWTYHTFATPQDAAAIVGVMFHLRGDGSPHLVRAVLKGQRHGEEQFVAQTATNLNNRDWQRVFVPLDAFPGFLPDRPANLTVVGFAAFQSGGDNAAEFRVDNVRLVGRHEAAPAPRLLQPEDDFAGRTPPELAWEPVADATGYRVTLAPDADFAETRAFTVTEPRLRLADVPEGRWHWRVEALGDQFLLALPSPARRLTFDTTPPRVLQVEPRPERLRLIFDDELTEAPEVRINGAAPASPPTVEDTQVLVDPDGLLAAGPVELTVRGAVNRVGLRQETVQTLAVTVPDWLPLVEDRSQRITRASVRPEDLDWFGRQALGARSELSEALRATTWIANAIDGVVGSETFGWQASHRYRSNPQNPSPWDRPFNSRIMEAIYTPILAYTLDRPFNPYYADPNLRRRLEVALAYWLDLQGENGGMPEYRGFGSEELPSTSFGIEFLVEVYAKLRDEPAFDRALVERLLAATKRMAEWSATPGQHSTEQGYHYSNQYCGALYGMWRLWELTGEERFRRMYDERLDAWIENAQRSGFWYEADGVETFGYSRITEWAMDRIYLLNNDPRIRDSLERYYRWCALNTVVEQDERTFIMDNLGHARTSANGPRGDVGFYNHIATHLPSARPWATSYAMSEAERAEHTAAWLAAPVTDEQPFPPAQHAYNPFAPYMYFTPHGLHTITEEERLAALRELPTLARERFTVHVHSEWGNDHYLFARRPGIYATLHWGIPNHKQGKEVGLVWLPGFGTLLRSYNDSPNWAACTRVGEHSTYKQPIANPDIQRGGDTDPITVTARYENPPVTKSWTVADGGFALRVAAPNGAIEQIPIYLAADDTLLLDGQPFAPGQPIDTMRTLRVQRGDSTAEIVFEKPVQASLRRIYNLAQGAVHMLRVQLPENGLAVHLRTLP